MIVLRYLWAGPTSLIGLMGAGLSIITGGGTRIVDGVLEVHGGLLGWILRHAPLPGGVAALALGHVVLGRDTQCLHETRAHERVHVQQCERWGPVFLPAYLVASLWALVRGKHPYRDNWFERQAVAQATLK